MWIADAHRGDGKRFVVHADAKLTAFLELDRAKRCRTTPDGLRSHMLPTVTTVNFPPPKKDLNPG